MQTFSNVIKPEDSLRVPGVRTAAWQHKQSLTKVPVQPVRILKGPTEIRTLPVQMSDTLFCTVYLAWKEVSFFPCQKRVKYAH